MISLQYSPEYSAYYPYSKIYYNWLMISDGHLYNRPDPDESIISLHNKQYVNILLRNILFCEAEGNYTNVYLKGDQRLVIVCKRLFFFRRKLKKYNVFHYCHRSYIINLDEVNGYCNKNKKRFLLISVYRIPVARGKWNELLLLLLKKNIKRS